MNRYEWGLGEVLLGDFENGKQRTGNESGEVVVRWEEEFSEY